MCCIAFRCNKKSRSVNIKVQYRCSMLVTSSKIIGYLPLVTFFIIFLLVENLNPLPLSLNEKQNYNANEATSRKMAPELTVPAPFPSDLTFREPWDMNGMVRRSEGGDLGEATDLPATTPTTTTTTTTTIPEVVGQRHAFLGPTPTSKVRVEIFVLPLPNDQYQGCPAHAQPLVVPMRRWSGPLKTTTDVQPITICLIVQADEENLQNAPLALGGNAPLLRPQNNFFTDFDKHQLPILLPQSTPSMSSLVNAPAAPLYSMPPYSRPLVQLPNPNILARSEFAENIHSPTAQFEQNNYSAPFCDCFNDAIKYAGRYFGNNIYSKLSHEPFSSTNLKQVGPLGPLDAGISPNHYAMATPPRPPLSSSFNLFNGRSSREQNFSQFPHLSLNHNLLHNSNLSPNSNLPPNPNLSLNSNLPQNPNLSPYPNLPLNTNLTPNPNMLPNSKLSPNPNLSLNPNSIPNFYLQPNPNLSPNPLLSLNPNLPLNPNMTPIPNLPLNPNLTPIPNLPLNPNLTPIPNLPLNPNLTPNSNLPLNSNLTPNPKLPLNPNLKPIRNLPPDTNVPTKLQNMYEHSFENFPFFRKFQLYPYFPSREFNDYHTNQPLLFNYHPLGLPSQFGKHWKQRNFQNDHISKFGADVRELEDADIFMQNH